MAKVKVKNQALDILSSISDNRCRAILTQIVKLRPSVIIAANNVLKDVQPLAPPLHILYSKLHLEDPTIEKIVKRAARHSSKISCIKIYRALTNVGLKESKDFIEATTRDWAEHSTSSVFPTVVSHAVKLETLGDAQYYNFTSVLVRMLCNAQYEKAFNYFINYYGLENDESTVLLFERYLKALYVIE